MDAAASVTVSDADPVPGRLLLIANAVEDMESLALVLASHGFETTRFDLDHDEISALASQEFDVVLLDIPSSGAAAFDSLEEIRTMDPFLVPIVMTDPGTSETKHDASNLGDHDVVTKSRDLLDVLPALRRAVAISRQRRARARNRGIDSVSELIRAMSLTSDVETILERTLDAAISLSEADEGSILLPTNDGRALAVTAARGPRCRVILNEKHPVDVSIAGWVFRHRETLSFRGPVRDSRFPGCRSRPEIACSVSLPLRAGGQSVGVLNLNVTRTNRQYTAEQLKALEIIAGVVAPVLQAASLRSKLRATEEKFDQVATTTRELICQVTADGQIQWVMPSCTSILGHSPAKMQGRSIWDFIVPEDRARCEPVFERLRQMPEPLCFESRWRRASDKVLWLESSVKLHGDVSSRTESFLIVSRDVSERKHAEQWHRQSERQFRQICDNLIDGMLLTDSRGVVCMVNDAFCRIVGKSRVDLEGNLYSMIYQEAYVEPLARYRERFIGRDIESRSTVNTVLWNGRAVEFDVSRSFLEQPGRPPCLLSIIRDVTEQRKLETQLRQAQKMEAFGQLAGGVAHDFNNLLTVITGYSEMILEGIAPRDTHEELLRDIRQAGERAIALTRQLLAFSRKQAVQLVELNLNNLVESTERLLRRLIGEDIHLATTLDPQLGSVMADAGQMEQVIINLVVNARDAMPTGGVIQIETSNVDIDDDSVARSAESRPGKFVKISVTDTGCGMDAATKSMIFDPFFTTKSHGNGTGLGLATVHGIIKQCGGCIEVFSEPNQGASFQVLLPRITRMDSAAKTVAAVSPMVRGTETILVTEDDESVRNTIVLALQTSGYTVLSATDGVEAEYLCKIYEGPIHLLITDVVMPRMSARRLVEVVSVIRPETKVMYLSGYTDDAVFRHGALNAGAFLQKPFTPSVLTKKVREVLDP